MTSPAYDANKNLSNAAISGKLHEYANLLKQQGADGFRERAYRRAAETVANLPQAVGEMFANKGLNGLIALPDIGKAIASAIAQMLIAGHWAQLDRLRGDLSAEKLFQTIPGIGPELSKRLADEAHLETLEDLETAIHLGKPIVKGLGPRRREAIAAVLGERLGGFVVPGRVPGAAQPPVSMLLNVDAMYRARSEAGKLRTIAPKRFNPTGRSWLPIMHASHEHWHFTALFSNTARAHQLGRLRDWVVIYYQDDDTHREGRATVVTEIHGAQAGKRVVRGRETECATLLPQQGDSGKPANSAH